MPYSTSIKTIERMRPHLERLERLMPCEWEVGEGKESAFSYKIREALYAAKVHAARYPRLARAYDSFRIKIVSSGRVVAIPKGVSLAAYAEEPPASIETVAITGDAGASPPDEPVFQEVVPLPARDTPAEVAAPPQKGKQSPFTVVQDWGRAKHEGYTKLSFVEADLSDTDLAKVWRWTRKHEPPLVMVYSAPVLTLTYENDDNREIGWAPEGQ